MEHDPFVSSASPRDLIRMIDADPDASHRERRLCEFLADCMRDTSGPLEQAESRAEDAEEKAQEAESILEEARNDMQKIIDRLDAFL